MWKKSRIKREQERQEERLKKPVTPKITTASSSHSSNSRETEEKMVYGYQVCSMLTSELRSKLKSTNSCPYGISYISWSIRSCYDSGITVYFNGEVDIQVDQNSSVSEYGIKYTLQDEIDSFYSVVYSTFNSVLNSIGPTTVNQININIDGKAE